MPYTPLHVIAVWPVWKRFPERLDFVALTVGAVIPDLFELVFLFLLPGFYRLQRSVSHSLLGALTYDLGLALLGIHLVARPLLYWLDRKWPSSLWSRYAGLDYRTSRPWRVVILSAAIGTLSHVLLDVPFHSVNLLFFPIPLNVVIFPTEYGVLASYLGHAIVGVFLVYLLWVNWWRPALREEKST